MKKARYIAIAAITMDGKIARDSKHLSTTWTSKEDKAFLKRTLDGCDAIILGRNTYETAKKLLIKRKRNCIVFTRRVKGVTLISDKLTHINPTPSTLRKLVSERGYQRVAILGGTETYTYCMKKGFLDELYITVEPVIFGNGLSLFNDNVLDRKMVIKKIETLNAKGTILIHSRFFSRKH
jgi:dihydrofolate reductase